MNRKLSLLAALALVHAGCADNRSSLQIRGRAAPADEAKCTFQGGGQTLLGPGLLDLSSLYAPHGYLLPVYVKNTLADPVVAAPGASSTAKTWSPRAALVRVNPGAYVEQFRPNPALLPVADAASQFVVPLSGIGTPVGTENVEAVEAMTAELASALVQSLALNGVPAGEVRQIVLGVTLRGETLDGEGLDTGEWYFPLRVCSGCLFVPTCPSGSVLTPGSCGYLGQDVKAECSSPVPTPAPTPTPTPTPTPSPTPAP